MNQAPPDKAYLNINNPVVTSMLGDLRRAYAVFLEGDEQEALYYLQVAAGAIADDPKIQGKTKRFQQAATRLRLIMMAHVIEQMTGEKFKPGFKELIKRAAPLTEPPPAGA